MLNKEEIKKAKERIQNSLNDICFATLYSQEQNDEDEKTLLQYIRQLEQENKQYKTNLKKVHNRFDNEEETLADLLNYYPKK